MNKKINPEHINKVIEMMNASPFLSNMKMRIVSMEEGITEMEADMNPGFLNPFGGVHGGVYATMIDTACYWASYCDIDENVVYTSVDLSVTNLAYIKGRKLYCTGRVIRTGRTIGLSEATIKDENGVLLAHGTSKILKMEGRQTMKQAAEVMGISLPPKYL